MRGIGVTGLAESGVLLDAARRPAAPVIAWFDHRGGNEIEEVGRQSPEFAAAFARTTGLPWSSQASIAKLLWLRSHGYLGSHSYLGGRASTWLSVPEWIVYGLGGEPVREPSLASRTGLIDQGTGAVWADALAAAGLPARILPDERPAGFRAGYLAHEGVVSCAAGAVLTVAGHDHPVAAIGVGAVDADELFNSSGTADVLARSVPGTLDETQRQRVVAAGWSLGLHVLPDTSLLLAGVSGGLLLRRVLAALGAESAQARTALHNASLAVGDLPDGLSVTGDGRTQDDGGDPPPRTGSRLGLDGRRPLHRGPEARLLLGEDRAGGRPAPGRALAAGGWTQMASVRAAKAAAIEAMSFSAWCSRASPGQPWSPRSALRPGPDPGRIHPAVDRRLGSAEDRFREGMR